MDIRKNVRSLTAEEKQRYVQAVRALKANGKYDQYVLWHIQAMNRPTPSTVSPSVRNAAHRGPAFLPWHREFLRRFELDLQAEVPGVTIPYWNWAEDAATPSPASAPVWGNDLMGGNGDPGDGDIVKAGPFRQGEWTIVSSTGSPAGPLRRAFGVNVSTLPSLSDVSAALAVSQYDSSPWHRSSNPSFRNQLEGWLSGLALHNRVHVWVGGSMLPGTSPNDPVFFLHHCHVDKIWADWQTRHPGSSYLPASGGPEGHNLNDPMFPLEVTPASVLDFKKMGYVYDGACLQIGYGRTPFSSTKWINYGADGIYVDVDTSSAKFTSQPVYMTSIGGNSNHWTTTGATSIYNATPTGFRVYIYKKGVTPSYANDRKWHINWAGIVA